jgi:hypothetical protein
MVIVMKIIPQRFCHIMTYQNTAQSKSIAADQMLGLEPELLLARGARPCGYYA